MAVFPTKTRLPSYLRDIQLEIEGHAREYGLDFYPVIFEVLNYAQMNEVAAYGGFPTRYPHWRFGMEYERLKKSHEYGLSKIYEMVINNNPSIAYLLEGNSLVDQKLVISHVLGHVDFFKNNFSFSVTNQGIDRRTGEPIRKWIDTLANHGAIIRKWSNRVGVEKVEEFIDYCLRLENLIDPQRPFAPKEEREDPLSQLSADEPRREEPHLLPVTHDYMESFINPDEFVQAQRKRIEDDEARKKRFPERPRRDVLSFLLENAPLENWEYDALNVVRREAYYFLPQMQTKIMNEGWASYWHSKLMTSRVCSSQEIIDYSERNAGVMRTSPTQLNPYKLGVELYRHIEARWDKGQFGKEWEECDDYEQRAHWDRRTGMGRKKIFDVRKIYNDVTFIDTFLTPDFVIEQKLFSFGYNQRNSRFEIETRQFADVKSKLINQLTNAGSPIITVADANFGNDGTLLMEHDHQGVDLRVDWAQEVLQALVRIWRRPVVLHTVLENKPSALRFDGSEHTTKPR